MAFFFRIGKLAAKSVTSGGAVGQYSNLRFLAQQGSVNMIKIHLISAREDILTLCPVPAIVEFCKLRGTHAGPLFAIGPQAQAEWVSLTQNSEVASGFSDLKLRSARLAAGNPMHLNFACIVPDTMSAN